MIFNNLAQPTHFFMKHQVSTTASPNTLHCHTLDKMQKNSISQGN